MSTVPCVLGCGNLCCEATDAIGTVESWTNIKEKAQLWSGLDKFGDVFESVDWENGPGKQCVHKTCKLTLYPRRARAHQRRKVCITGTY